MLFAPVTVPVYAVSAARLVPGARVKVAMVLVESSETLPVGLVMSRAIRAYRERTGHLVGFKPAGGIRKAKESLDWLDKVRVGRASEEDAGAFVSRMRDEDWR